jgi:hypothetical protein
MHSACHEEGDEQLAVGRASREMMAHEEPSLQKKTKKSRMQQADSAASLGSSMRDAATEQEGDDVVKPMQVKNRTRPPDDDPHERRRAKGEEHLEVRGVGVIEDDESCRQDRKKRDVHQVDTRSVESPRSAASTVGQGRGSV